MNITVADPDATARLLTRLFGWHIRWQGKAMETGRTIHVGNDESYLALYTPHAATDAAPDTHVTRGALNHIGVIVDDLDGGARRCHGRGVHTRPGG